MKFLLMTINLQTTIKATLKKTKPKNSQNGFKKPHGNTKFRSLTEIFSHLNFSLS